MDSNKKKRKTIDGLRRVRAQLCRMLRTEDEIEKCPCIRGALDINADHGAQTGCKEIFDAIKLLKDDE